MTNKALSFGMAALALALCAPATASTLETLTVSSTCADPQRVTMSDPPAGKPRRSPGRMWDLRFRFATPPDVLETFVRDGDRLRGEGKGDVVLRTADGCQLDATLPFDLDVRTTRCARR